ncbi:hypothetical protein [Saccharothrix carnea]|uniref:hypothetical protein n=1 Tax=Saccharothrix carnea TaxID=1280637 RepID=UPI001FECA3B1|nr:hypothetical protein [Saccharothrix carnea]
MAAQLGVAAGLRVIGTASPANQEHVAALGATPTTYGEGLVERVRAPAPEGIDAVFDVAGKGALPASIELRGGTDRIVTIADAAAAAELGVVFTGGPQQRSARRLADLAELAAKGELTTVVGGHVPAGRRRRGAPRQRGRPRARQAGPDRLSPPPDTRTASGHLVTTACNTWLTSTGRSPRRSDGGTGHGSTHAAAPRRGGGCGRGALGAVR